MKPALTSFQSWRSTKPEIIHQSCITTIFPAYVFFRIQALSQYTVDTLASEIRGGLLWFFPNGTLLINYANKHIFLLLTQHSSRRQRIKEQVVIQLNAQKPNTKSEKCNSLWRETNKVSIAPCALSWQENWTEDVVPAVTLSELIGLCERTGVWSACFIILPSLTARRTISVSLKHLWGT